MIIQYDIVGDVMFSQSLLEIRQRVESSRKNSFVTPDRSVIYQDTTDEYPYVDAVGTILAKQWQDVLQ